jgi:hypothetical protein
MVIASIVLAVMQFPMRVDRHRHIAAFTIGDVSGTQAGSGWLHDPRGIVSHDFFHRCASDDPSVGIEPGSDLIIV